MKRIVARWLLALLGSLQAFAWPSPLNAQDSSATAGPRTWTAADGRTLEARLVSDLGWKVVIERNGTPMTIPLTSLSLPDREWLDAQWLSSKSQHIDNDPMSGIDAAGSSGEVVRLVEQIRDLGFTHPIWRVLAAPPSDSSGIAKGPALRLRVRKASFRSSSDYSGTPPRSAAVYYVLVNSSQAGGTIAYAEVVWDEDQDLFSSSPSLAQALAEQIEAEKYTALALAGEYKALKHYALEVLESAKTPASIVEQRACLLALGDGRCVDSMEMARLCVEKLPVAELCLEAARALGLAKGLDPKAILPRLEALREQLKRNDFHSKSATARQGNPLYWSRLGVEQAIDLHQVVDFAITRLAPSQTLARLDRNSDYEERLHLLALLRPHLLDEIERTGATSEKIDPWMANLMRQCDPLAARLLLDALETCEDEKDFRRLVKHFGAIKLQAGYWHRGTTNLRGCDANPFRKSWGWSESFPVERFLDRDRSPDKFVPLPLHERAVEMLAGSLAKPHGALTLLENLEESALSALPELSRYLQQLQEQPRSEHTRGVVLETIGSIATAARARNMKLPPLPGLAEAAARELTVDSPIAEEACVALKPLGKQAAAALPQMQALVKARDNPETAPSLTDAMASIQLDAAVSN